MDKKSKSLSERYKDYFRIDNSQSSTPMIIQSTSIAERYTDYFKNHQNDFRQHRIDEEKREALKNNKNKYVQRLQKCQQLKEDLTPYYEYALTTIKPEYRKCELVDMNLCFRSLTDNTLDFLSPVHFDNDVLNDRQTSTDTEYDTYPHKPTLYFDSLEAFEEYEENGTPTYSLEPPDSELYDDIQITEKKENLCIKKSYKQYKVIKEYLTLENKIKRYENLIERCDKLPVHYDRAIFNIQTDPILMTFLYNLTKGDLKKFYELARFCAKITDTKAKNKAFVIYADPTVYDALILFIGAATNKLLKPCSFKSMRKKQVLLELQNASMNNAGLGLVCIDEPIPDTTATATALKKVMKGNIITVKDAYYPVDLRIVNRIPMIYLTQNRNNFQRMKNIFSATALEFHSENIEMPYISPQALLWLRNDFISLVMCNIQETEKHPQKPAKVNKDDVIEGFIETVCIRGKEYNCPIQELYSAYCNFYKKFYGNDYLTQIKFTKTFAAVTNLQKYRPHYKGQSNVYYFKGIKIDETKINPQPVKDEDMKKNEADSEKKYSTTFRDFCADIKIKQSVLYQQQQENIRIFNYQQNMEE